MLDEQKELKKIKGEVKKLIGRVPELRWMIEEQKSIRRLKEKTAALVERCGDLHEECWANDLRALERERRESAPELTPDGAPHIFFANELYNLAQGNYGREISEHQMLVISRKKHQQFDERHQQFEAEYQRLALEHNEKLRILWEEIVRLRELGPEWLEQINRLVEKKNKYLRFEEQKIGVKLALVEKLFAQSSLTVCTNLTYHRLCTALVLQDFTKAGVSACPTHIFDEELVSGAAQIKPPKISGPTVAARVAETEVFEAELVKRMFELRDKLSDLDADVLDILFAFWMWQVGSEEELGAAAIDHILWMRGLKPKIEGRKKPPCYDTNQRVDVLNSIKRLESIWLDVRQRVNRAIHTTNEYESLQDQLIVVTDREGPERSNGEMVVRFIVFQPGRVFRPFLLGPGRQTALLSMKAIQYNPYKRKYEKRMARYLSWIWRVRGFDANAQAHKVETLLNEVGLRVNRRNPSEAYERLDELFSTLEEDKVIASWKYRDWEDALVGKRGWVDRWLEARMLIELPDEIRQSLANVMPTRTRPVMRIVKHK